jgi:hypothetical protein
MARIEIVEQSITATSEAELIDVVFARDTWRLVMGLPPLASSDWPHRLRVPLPRAKKATKTSGDIDILTMPPALPDRAIAAEAKLVRVGADAFYTIEPNGLSNWQQGIKQANRLAAHGFHCVYLYMFVLVDSRANNSGAWTYKGASSQLDERISQAMHLDRIDTRVGVVENRFVQPVDRTPFEFGTAQSSIIRMATSVAQPDEVTGWVRSEFARPPSN